MALVDTETGEVIAECSPDEARELTDRIRDGLTTTWQLVVEAHDRRAWKAMGYGSFRSWVESELNMSRGHAYRLLDHGRVMQALAEHAGVSPNGDIPEGLTRGLTPEAAVELAKDLERDLPAEPTEQDRIKRAERALADLGRTLAEKQRRERERAATAKRSEVGAPPVGESERGKCPPDVATVPASEPEPADPVDVEKHADPRLTFRANFSRDIAKAGVLRMVDVDKAVACADPDDLAGFRQSVESIRDWCDRFLAASNTATLRRVK